MKKLILFYILTFVISQITFAQNYGWTDISANLPQYSNYNDVHFIGEEGWITGWNDGLLYTPDGGETFQIQQLPANSGITSSVFMKNNQEGYVVTFLGNILKTDNGGTIWTTLHEPGGGLNSVHFPPNSDTGYACGTNGTVWMFDNISITDISPPDNTSNLRSICFPTDNNDGKVCGQTTIARRKNNTWSNLQFYDSSLDYNSIFFIDDTTGWAIGTFGAIVLTVDGVSWVRQTSNTNHTLNDVFFINSLEGWAAGSEVLLHTVDGGENWTREIESLTVGKELRAIYFTSPTKGYVVGNGVVLKYGEILGVVDEIESLKFEIYPNPATNKIQIKCSEFKTESGTLEILSLDGKEILKKEIRQGTENSEINVGHLETGLYLCKISTDKRSSTKKLIIE